MPLIKRSEIFSDQLSTMIDNILKEKELNQEKLQYVNDTLQEIDQRILERAKAHGLPIDLFVPLKTVLEEGVPSFSAVDNISVYVDRKTKPKLPTKVTIPSLSGEILDLEKIKQKYGKEVAEEIEKILESINKIEEAKQSISTQYAILQKELARILSPIENTLSNYSTYTRRLLQYLFWLLNKYNIKAVRKDGLIYALRAILESTGRIQRSKVTDFLKLFAKIIQKEYGITVNVEHLMRELMGDKLSIELARIKDIGEAAVEKIEEAIEKIRETRAKESSICPKLAVMPALVGFMFHDKAASMVKQFDRFLLSVIASLEYASLIEDVIKGSLIEPHSLVKIAEEQSSQPPAEGQGAQSSEEGQGSQSSEEEQDAQLTVEDLGQGGTSGLGVRELEYWKKLIRSGIYIVILAEFLVKSVDEGGSIDNYVDKLKDKFGGSGSERVFSLDEAIKEFVGVLSNSDEDKRRLQEVARSITDKLRNEWPGALFTGLKDSITSSNALKVFSKFFSERYEQSNFSFFVTNFFDVLRYLHYAGGYNNIIDSMSNVLHGADSGIRDMIDGLRAEICEKLAEIVEKPHRSFEIKTRDRFRRKVNKFIDVVYLPDENDPENKQKAKAVPYIDGNKLEFFVPRSAVLLTLPCLPKAQEMKLELSEREIKKAVEDIRTLSELMYEVIFKSLKEFASAPTAADTPAKITNIYPPLIQKVFYLPPSSKQHKSKAKKDEPPQKLNLVPVIQENMKADDMRKAIVDLVKNLQTNKLISASIYLLLETIASGDVSIGGNCGAVLDILLESFGDDIVNLAERFAGNLYDTLMDVLKDRVKEVGAEGKSVLETFENIYVNTHKNPYLLKFKAELNVDPTLSFDDSLMVGEVKKDLSVLVQRYLEFAVASLFGYDSRNQRTLVNLKFVGRDGFEQTAAYYRPIAIRLATFFTSLSAVLPDESVDELIESAKKTLENLSSIVFKTIENNKGITEATGSISMVGSKNRQYLGSLLAAIVIVREVIKSMRVTFDLDLPLKELSLNRSLRPKSEDDGGATSQRDSGGPRTRPPRSPEAEPPSSPRAEQQPENSQAEQLRGEESEASREETQKIELSAKSKEDFEKFARERLSLGVEGRIVNLGNSAKGFVIPIHSEKNPKGRPVHGKLVQDSILELSYPGEYVRYHCEIDLGTSLYVWFEQEYVKGFLVDVYEPLSEYKPEGSTPKISGIIVKIERYSVAPGLLNEFSEKLKQQKDVVIIEKNGKWYLASTLPDVQPSCVVTPKILKSEGDVYHVKLTPRSCPNIKSSLKCNLNTAEDSFYALVKNGQLDLVELKNLKIGQKTVGIGVPIECDASSDKEVIKNMLQSISTNILQSISAVTEAYIFAQNQKVQIIVPITQDGTLSAQYSTACKGTLTVGEGNLITVSHNCNIGIPQTIQVQYPENLKGLIVQTDSGIRAISLHNFAKEPHLYTLLGALFEVQIGG